VVVAGDEVGGGRNECYEASAEAERPGSGEARPVRGAASRRDARDFAPAGNDVLDDYLLQAALFSAFECDRSAVRRDRGIADRGCDEPRCALGAIADIER